MHAFIKGQFGEVKILTQPLKTYFKTLFFGEVCDLLLYFVQYFKDCFMVRYHNMGIAWEEELRFFFFLVC